MPTTYLIRNTIPEGHNMPENLQERLCNGAPIPQELRDVPVFPTDNKAVAWALAHEGHVSRSAETGDYFEVPAQA